MKSIEYHSNETYDEKIYQKTKKPKNEIPIQNIYYMLSYAYKNLKINENVEIASEYIPHIYDLLSRLFIEAINNLIRRGFFKEYILENEDTSNIKGKINISESIKRRTTIYKKLNCSYDDFSENVIFNQIIKTTLENLIRINDLNQDYKKDLKKLKLFFNNVNSINLNKNTFKSIMWNRNNRYYILIINICELIYKYRLPNENTGTIHFKDFIQNYEKEMAILFENFVFNFYKKELNKQKVYRPRINWKIDNSYQYNQGLEVLPKMLTDIVLEFNDKQLIIDTKFYKDILRTNYEKPKLYSPNLYQIYSYVNNSDFDGEIIGMLLYASIGDDINYQYKIGNNLILIKTINLNQIGNKLKKD
ncbi:MAG: hypothetical protein LBM96_10700 [Methanobrevibacter sp.]|jgi:5-methylcytosine-specific restriction enzyme subunit McrC|nr:hypothetical protein [Candidatus Methanoflexus mossambicus]